MNPLNGIAPFRAAEFDDLRANKGDRRFSDLAIAGLFKSLPLSFDLQISVALQMVRIVFVRRAPQIGKVR